MTSTSDEAFRKHIASFNDMATAEEWKRRYEAHDSLVKALEAAGKALKLSLSALHECEAILGCEYADHYGPLSETMAKLYVHYRDLPDVIATALSQVKGGK